MQAPEFVVAGAEGGFDYDWMFVVDAPFVIAGLGSSDLHNTNGHYHGDCFCFPNCAAAAGDTIRWHVSGSLVDTASEGQVSNWIAGCEGEGGSSTTTILPYGTIDVPDPRSEVSLRLWSQPNPSHGRVRFHYVLPASGHVSLRVYDLMGRHVATLVDRVESAGARSMVWNAPGSPSTRGIYFARLKLGSRTRTVSIAID